MEQLALFEDDKYQLSESHFSHCMTIQEAIEKHFKINMRVSSFRIVAFHLKDKSKFIARIAGSFYFCELVGEKINWPRSYHGNGDQLYRWIQWVEGENNQKVDLLMLWCRGNDLRKEYEKDKAYLEGKRLLG